MDVMVGSPYATAIFAFPSFALFVDGGAVQKGRDLRPGRKKRDGDGRWTFVFAKRDGP